MRSDLSEHYYCVQKGMKNHIRVIWTHTLFSNCPNLQIILRYFLCFMSIVNKHLYSVETTYGINSVISKIMTFVKNTETGQFLFLIVLIFSYFTCS
jgi:hypothetical protein